MTLCWIYQCSIFLGIWIWLHWMPVQLETYRFTLNLSVQYFIDLNYLITLWENVQYFSHHHNCHLIKFIIFWYYRPSLPFLNRLSKNQRSWAAHVAPLLYGLSFTSGHTWQNFMHQQSFQYYTRQMILHPVKCFFNDAWNGKFFLESKVPKPAGSRGSRILSNIPHRFRILEKRYAKKTCQIVARELWPLKCLQPFGCL